MTSKKLPFELNEAMFNELWAERRGAQTVARAQARMIIDLFESNAIPGDTGFGAMLATVNAIEKATKRELPLQLVGAISKLLSAGCRGDEANAGRHYIELIEQLMEHHFDLGQQPENAAGD